MMLFFPLLILLASAVVVFSKDPKVVTDNVRNIVEIMEGKKKLASALLDPATASKTADELAKAIIVPFKLICRALRFEIAENQVKHFILENGKGAAEFLQLSVAEKETAMNEFPPEKACAAIDSGVPEA